MEVDSAVPASPGLARYACDFCRAKKIRCTREIPKCNACKPWPSECVYSVSRKIKRHRFDASLSTVAQRISQPSLAAALTARPAAKAGDHVVARLDRIEAALKGLTTAIANLTTSHQQPSEAPTPRSRTSAATKGSPPSDHPTASLVSLDDATDQLRRIREQTESTKEQDDASHHLQDLATAMTTITLKGLSPSTQDTAAHGGFFVPTKAVGYTLMGHFLNVMELADIMTLRPPDDLLHRVIFEPQHVSQSAWIVTINFVLYAMSSKDKDAELAPSFRNNARLALDDANIYLAPSEANIQMLLLLASHGDEFASPNLSWMLLGHACRQAQALGLNSPDSEDEGTRQRQLCLFWALFMVDKSCSVAFGRPCFLPTRLYGDCEMPDEAHLQKYRPHLGPTEQARTSQFGMHFWLQSLQVAKVAGSILDLDARAIEEDGTMLQRQLEACHVHTQKLLSADYNSELPECTPQQARELELGVKTLEFNYLHLSIVLKQRRVLSADNVCLDIARRALRLLPSLVSNWTQVYNGPTWQLLYYPFTPFLILFRHLTSSTSNVTEEDLALMRSTVSYFESMVAQVDALSDIASKLAQTAASFTAFAESLQQAAPALENEYSDMLLQFLPDETNIGGADPSRKRTFDAAFDWFSWEAYVQDDGSSEDLFRSIQ